MIRHQSAMIVSIYIEIGASFLLWKSESKIKLSPSSKLRTDSLRRCDVQFCLQKKNAKNLKNEVRR